MRNEFVAQRGDCAKTTAGCQCGFGRISNRRNQRHGRSALPDLRIRAKFLAVSMPSDDALSRGTRCGAPVDDSPQRELWVGSRNGDKPRRGDRFRDCINTREPVDSVAPPGLWFHNVRNPALTRWATICRCSAPVATASRRAGIGDGGYVLRDRSGSAWSAPGKGSRNHEIQDGRDWNGCFRRC
jgi:hypothetical protein